MRRLLAAAYIGLVLGSFGAAAQTAYRTHTADGRGALVVQAGGCTVIIASGRTPETPPDTETHGSCDVRMVARKLAR